MSFRVCGLLAALILAADVPAEEWKIHPCHEKGEAKDYRPAFKSHFKLGDGVLTGTCALGPDFYKSMEKQNVFVGAGILWATHASWPADAENFEFVYDYRWFQEEPLVKYGDFPDMHLGFRLDAQGRGYYIRWGMLGQIIIRRMDADASREVGHGTLPGMKGKWARVKLRVAGPIIKVKIWYVDRPEPDSWSAEAYDDWSAAGATTYKRGAVALGFRGRKLFDACVYEFKDAKFTSLTAALARQEKSFDARTAPAYIGYANNSDTTPIKVPEPAAVIAKDVGLTRDANAQLGFAEDAMTITSADGTPAYVWKAVNPKAALIAVRMRSESGARPLFALRATSNGQQHLAYLDPTWREGLAALLWQDAGHTTGAYRFSWQPDTWYDFVLQKAHWHKWQILDTRDEKNRAAFSAAILPPAQELLLGIGVAGKGSVTVKGFTAK